MSALSKKTCTKFHSGAEYFKVSLFHFIEDLDETISDEDDEDDDENNNKPKKNRKMKNDERQKNTQEKPLQKKMGMSKISCYLARVDGDLYGKYQADGKNTISKVHTVKPFTCQSRTSLG